LPLPWPHLYRVDQPCEILAGLGVTLVTPVVPAVVASLLPRSGAARHLAMVDGRSMVLGVFMFGMPLGSLIGAQFGGGSTFHSGGSDVV